MRRGMKINKGHEWKYTGEWDEVKRSPKKWLFKYRAIKTRTKKAPKGSGMPKGSKLVWGIRGVQYAKKINKDQYLITTQGVKWRKKYNAKQGWKN